MTPQYYKVKYQGSEDKRAKTAFFECSKYDVNGFTGRKVNKQGEYTKVKWTPEGWHDDIHIITSGCIIDASLVIHDFKYGELVVPEDASQNNE